MPTDCSVRCTPQSAPVFAYRGLSSHFYAHIKGPKVFHPPMSKLHDDLDLFDRHHLIRIAISDQMTARSLSRLLLFCIRYTVRNINGSILKSLNGSSGISKKCIGEIFVQLGFRKEPLFVKWIVTSVSVVSVFSVSACASRAAVSSASSLEEARSDFEVAA